MEDLNVLLARLEERMAAGFRSVDIRFDDQDQRADRQHTENVARIDRIDSRTERIEVEVRRTNGRVTRLEDQVKAVWKAIDRKVGTVTKDVGERMGISQRDIRMGLIGGGILIAAWRFVEWAVPLLQQRHP